jgi:hypothetical protein
MPELLPVKSGGDIHYFEQIPGRAFFALLDVLRQPMF